MKSYTKTSNSKQSSISVLAVIKILAGLLLLIPFGATAFVENVIDAMFGVSMLPMSFIGGMILVLSIWVIACGFIDFARLGFARELDALLEKSPQTLPAVGEIIGKSPAKILKGVGILKAKGFYKSVALLEDCIVFERNESARPLMLMTEKGMRFEEGKKRLLDSVLVALTIALLLGANYAVLRTGHGYIFATLVAIVLAAMAFMLKKPIPRLMYKEIPVKEIIIEMPKSGNELADELMKLAAEQIRELSVLDHAIEDEHVSNRLQEIITATRQLIEFLRANPHKHLQAKQLIDYALPTAIKLLNQYVYLSEQPVKGDNIMRSMKKIVEMSDSLSATMRRELDALYADDTIDIEVDVEVMSNMLGQEGFGFNVKNNNNIK